MSNLSLTTTWEAGIYQLEQNDPVDAGVGGNGISNLQARQLGNRTEYLKQESDNHANDLTNINTNITTLFNTGIVMFGGRKHRLTVLVGTVTLDEPTHGGCLLWATGGVITTQAASAGATDGVSYTIFNASSGLLQINGVWTDFASPNTTIYMEHGDCIELTQYKINAGVLRTVIKSWSRKNVSPVGSVIAFAGSAIPTGYLKCNGAALAQASYPELYAVLGTTYDYLGAPGAGNFRLPDLRAEFLRGFDDGRGIDAGRVIGTAQAEGVNTAGVQLREASATWASAGAGVGSSFAYFENSNIAAYGTNMTVLGGTETRPRNVAMHYLIKY